MKMRRKVNSATEPRKVSANQTQENFQNHLAQNNTKTYQNQPCKGFLLFKSGECDLFPEQGSGSQKCVFLSIGIPTHCYNQDSSGKSHSDGPLEAKLIPISRPITKRMTSKSRVQNVKRKLRKIGRKQQGKNSRGGTRTFESVCYQYD